MSAFLLGTISRQLDQLVAKTGQSTGVSVAQWNDLVARYNAERQCNAQLQARVDFLQRDVAVLEKNLKTRESDWNRLRATALEVQDERDALATENHHLRARLDLRNGR